MFSDIRQDKNIQHIRFEMRIIEKLCSLGNLNGDMYKIVLYIIRKTYGWQKDEDIITMAQIESFCKMARTDVCKIIKRLLERKIISRKSCGKKYLYKINDKTEEWVGLNGKDWYFIFPENLDISDFKNQIKMSKRFYECELDREAVDKAIKKYCLIHKTENTGNKKVYLGDLKKENISMQYKRNRGE